MWAILQITSDVLSESQFYIATPWVQWQAHHTKYISFRTMLIYHCIVILKRSISMQTNNISLWRKQNYDLSPERHGDNKFRCPPYNATWGKNWILWSSKSGSCYISISSIRPVCPIRIWGSSARSGLATAYITQQCCAGWNIQNGTDMLLLV